MRRWQMGIPHDFFAITECHSDFHQKWLSSSDNRALIKMPLQFLQLPARERVHTHQRQAQPPTACQLQQRELQRCHATSIPNGHFFLYLSLESFLKTIRHHGRPSSCVKFIENNTVVKKLEVLPSDPAEHFSTILPNFHGQLPFQREFMRRFKIQRFALHKQLQSHLISLTKRNK